MILNLNGIERAAVRLHELEAWVAVLNLAGFERTVAVRLQIDDGGETEIGRLGTGGGRTERGWSETGATGVRDVVVAMRRGPLGLLNDGGDEGDVEGKRASGKGGVLYGRRDPKLVVVQVRDRQALLAR